MYQSLIPPIASYKKGEPHLTSSDIDILCLWKLSEHNELFVVVLRRELKCSGHFDRRVELIISTAGMSTYTGTRWQSQMNRMTSNGFQDSALI